MMKVYCKDCKYSYVNWWGQIDCGQHVRAGYYIKTIDPITGIKEKKFIQNGIEKDHRKENKENNCKYYVRLWYKFGKPKTIGIADGKLSIAQKDDTGGLSII